MLIVLHFFFSYQTSCSVSVKLMHFSEMRSGSMLCYICAECFWNNLEQFFSRDLWVQR